MLNADLQKTRCRPNGSSSGRSSSKGDYCPQWKGVLVWTSEDGPWNARAYFSIVDASWRSMHAICGLL
eukprot:2549778-Pyramimonas_sp.AAC.1